MARSRVKRIIRRKGTGRIVELSDRDTSALVLLVQNPTVKVRSKLMADLSRPALRIARLLISTPKKHGSTSAAERLAAMSLRDWASTTKTAPFRPSTTSSRLTPDS